MNKDFKPPEYTGQIPYILMNFNDMDSINGQIMEIMESVLPEGKQLEAAKNVMKRTVRNYFHYQYEKMFSNLNGPEAYDSESYTGYSRAVWSEAIRVNHEKINDK